MFTYGRLPWALYKSEPGQQRENHILSIRTLLQFLYQLIHSRMEPIARVVQSRHDVASLHQYHLFSIRGTAQRVCRLATKSLSLTSTTTKSFSVSAGLAFMISASC